MHPNMFKPHRCARGWAFVTSDAAHIGQVSLYNNAIDGSYLVPLMITHDTYDGSHIATSSYQQGKVGTLSMTGVPIMVAIGVLPGQIFTAQTATVAPAGDFPFFGTTNRSDGWKPLNPFGVIPAGYSLVLSGFDNTCSVLVGFFWQVWRWYEYQKYMADVDPDL